MILKSPPSALNELSNFRKSEFAHDSYRSSLDFYG